MKLASKIQEHVSLKGLIPLKPQNSERAFATVQNPLQLMATSATIAPSSFGFVFIDSPRATTRSSVQLWTVDSEECGAIKTYTLSDPGYRFHLSANMLVTARYAKQCVSLNGIVAVTTNVDMSTIVKGAFETVFGYDGFLGELVYQIRSGGGNDSRYMSVDHETLLFFAKDPAKVPRITSPKSKAELKKYGKEDGIGRFYWDTFIRKQARNYYPIECPDGSFLDKDEHGNKISWLWSEKTFLERLNQGDVEFRELDGSWKLYYKDRIKELKILRSIVLQKDHLNEIIEEFPESTTGAELLTTEGSKEVKQYEHKPDYLKSSKYYKFLFNAFAKTARHVLVPFPEHFSAINGLLGSTSSATIHTTISPEFQDFFRKRSQDFLSETYISLANPLSPLTAISSIPEEDCLTYYCNLISARYGLESEFFEHRNKAKQTLRYSISGSTLFIVALTEDLDLHPLLVKLIALISKDNEVSNCELFLQADLPNPNQEGFSVPCSIHGIPQEFLA